MASWKRLFGKKNKKAHRKLEKEYDEWLRHLQDSYGPQQEKSKKEQNRSNRMESSQGDQR